MPRHSIAAGNIALGGTASFATKYRVTTIDTGMIKERQKRNVSKGAKDKVYTLRTAAAAIEIDNAKVPRAVVVSDPNLLTRNWVSALV